MTELDLIARLMEQMGFMQRSLAAFSVHQTEALRLALAMRILLYDGGRGKSLVTQLGIDRQGFEVPDEAYSMQEVVLRTGGTIGGFMMMSPPRDPRDFAPAIPRLPLEDWWSKTSVFVTGDEKLGAARAFTRRELALILANQAGGAHIDLPNLPEHYVRLILERPLRTSGRKANQAYAAIGRSSSELLHALFAYVDGDHETAPKWWSLSDVDW